MEFERRTKRGKAAETARMREDADFGATSSDFKSGEPFEPSPVPTGTSTRTESNICFEDANSSKLAKEGATFVQPKQSSPHYLDVAQLAIDRGDPLEAASIRLRLASIRIEGASSLRPSFLSTLCRPYIDPSIQPNAWNSLRYSHRLSHVLPGQRASIPSILSMTTSLGSDLSSLGLFNDVAARLIPSSSSSSPEDVDVVIRCEQKGRFFMKTSTDVGNGEGNAMLQGKVRNIFGGAESLEGSAALGTKTRRAFHAALVSPLLASPDHSISLSAFAQDRDLTAYASCIEGLRGIRSSLLVDAGPYGLHELAYELTHRHLGRLLPSASLSMRQSAGHSIKSSVSHLVTIDTRDDPFMATRGGLLKFFHEVAGLGGDASHYKAETEGQLSRCFGSGWASSVSARAGLLTPVKARLAKFSDRFQLGGPVSMRMFRYNSLGPREGFDSLGGDTYWALGASFFAPIPRRAEWPLKIHAFINAGQLMQLRGDMSPTKTLWNELLQPSSSIGLGLMYRQGGLRVELNAGMPLSARRGDGARKGVQLGIGISFL